MRSSAGAGSSSPPRPSQRKSNADFPSLLAYSCREICGHVPGDYASLAVRPPGVCQDQAVAAPTYPSFGPGSPACRDDIRSVVHHRAGRTDIAGYCQGAYAASNARPSGTVALEPTGYPFLRLAIQAPRLSRRRRVLENAVVAYPVTAGLLGRRDSSTC